LDNWIEKRPRGITIREELTDEWDNRGIEEQNEVVILTAVFLTFIQEIPLLFGNWIAFGEH
jgi:hypothetical protein